MKTAVREEGPVAPVAQAVVGLGLCSSVVASEVGLGWLARRSLDRASRSKGRVTRSAAGELEAEVAGGQFEEDLDDTSAGEVLAAGPEGREALLSSPAAEAAAEAEGEQ